MKCELTVSVALDVADTKDTARLEESLRNWLRQQPGVQAVTTRAATEGCNTSVWRAARKQAFGPALKHPFSPLR
ncbi:hypothetical protein [Azospirillum thermophilum]|uniref:Uncharacterized protein n=1 Tax=Azospirillum thermophilum TaxID=2202148 RepID=A0A2S2CQN5_9PROT|nr:hypothetical protein [Azospirillum thermophilum]AWK86680.1 hypothetical protein DEW08_10915 [Azospirillum thermophilum]